MSLNILPGHICFNDIEEKRKKEKKRKRVGWGAEEEYGT
jgi:hypothetical protein